MRRAANLISGTISTFPLERWRDDVKLPSGQLLTAPEDYRPYARTMAAIVRDLVFYPYAWVQVTERDYYGFPKRVRWLDPEYISFERNFGTAEVSEVYAFYKSRQIPIGDLICFEGPDEGLLVYGRESILTALMAEAAAKRYASPEIPTGYLQQEGNYVLEKGEIRDLLSEWQKARMEFATGYLNAGVSYKTTQSTAADLQLVEAREECALQISRHTGLPPRYMAVKTGDSMTYSNITEERSDLVDLCLAPFMASIAGRLSMSDRNGSPFGQAVKFSSDAFVLGVPTQQKPDATGTADSPPAPAAPQDSPSQEAA
ncbi:phage portal protein [Catenulispora sp. NF23]|nr:phage portal protein [Catenulispora pinistramenti]